MNYYYSIPRVHASVRGLAGEFDLKFDGSQLLLKVLVFQHVRYMRMFWKSKFGFDPSRSCLGLCKPLVADVLDPNTMQVVRVAPTCKTYFAVMGLLMDHLTTEIICHESVHAAIYFHKRVGKRKRWVICENPDPDDQICYPAGRIMAGVVSHLRKNGFDL